MATQNQAAWFNPQSDRLEAGGNGIVPSRMTTSQRLALTLGVNDGGLTVTDVTLGLLCVWTGTIWSIAGGGGSGSSGLVNVMAYGAKGDGSTNDTQAVVNAIAAASASGIKGILFPFGYTFLLNTRNGAGTADYVNIPDGFTVVIDGTITSSTGNSISFKPAGAVAFTSDAVGILRIAQGVDSRFIQFLPGYVVSFKNLRFISAGLNPTCITCLDSGTGTGGTVTITNCSAENGCGALYGREQASGSTNSVTTTLITGCRIQSIFNGNGILINAVAGLDRDILIDDVVVDTVSGDASGQAFAGFGIAVAGYSNFVYNPGAPTTRVQISNVQVNNVHCGVHVEYCNNVSLSDIVVDGVSSTVYPNGTETFGVVVYGSNDVSLSGVHVSNVTGDQINAWGIGIRGSNRNIHCVNCRTYNASFIIEQAIQSTAIGGVQPYELTTGSTLHMEACTSVNGVTIINAVGSIELNGCAFVGPLSYGPLSVVSYARNANVATLVLTNQNGGTGIIVGNAIKTSGIGAGFDAASSTITSVTAGGSTTTITFSNVGANVGTTAATGSVYVMSSALTVNCDPALYGANFTSVYRLSLNIENTRAANIYGASSFTLVNVSTASRYAANVQIHATGNNFPVVTAYLPITPVNRAFYTTVAANPTGVEFVVGDQMVNTVGGVAVRQFCTSGGFVSPGATSYAIISATAGTIKRTAGTSWFSNTPPWVVGQTITVTNGGTSVTALIQRIFLSGADEAMALLDPATGVALDLTSVGGPGTLAPTAIAAFSTF